MNEMSPTKSRLMLTGGSISRVSVRIWRNAENFLNDVLIKQTCA
jgi:hypothetical protein